MAESGSGLHMGAMDKTLLRDKVLGNMKSLTEDALRFIDKYGE